MNIGPVKNNIMLFFLLLCFMSFTSPLTFADPPSQAARLSYIKGAVSFLPAGETQWIDATINRPLIINDQLWSDTEALVEMQLPGADIRLGSQTALKILNLNDDVAQFQMTQGALVLIIKRLNSKVYEIDTPNLAFTISTPGYYRIDVSAENNTTVVSVGVGEGTAYGENLSNIISAGSSCTVTGTNLDNYLCTALSKLDDLDTWSLGRDKSSNDNATQYVSPDTVGYEDLASNGTWVKDEQYGQVWLPNSVDPDWAPYQNGQWIWLSEWGWTWVDDQPWGFAPFHYGRWAFINNHWCWVPGPVDVQPIYAPALTVFIGGDNSQLIINGGGYGIAWFPLAPGEVYVPPYYVSQHYFTAINLSNTMINVAYINNFYTHKNMKINYKNAQIANAVTVVPIEDFTNSMIVNHKNVHVSNQVLLSTPKTYAAPVVPKPISVFGGKKFSSSIPPEKIMSRSVIVKTKPSAATPSFKEGQQLILKSGNKPWSPLQIHKINTNKNINDIFEKVDLKNKKNINDVFQKVDPKDLMQHTPVFIKQAPPVVVHPLPAVPQSPGGQPKPKINPDTNIQPGQSGSDIYHKHQNYPKPNVQPGPIQTAPAVTPGSNIYHKQQGYPKPNVQPGPVQTTPAATPGSNIYHKQQGYPKPNVQPGAVQTVPAATPGSNTYQKQQGYPKPNVQQGPIQTNSNSQPNPKVHSAPLVHPQAPGLQNQPVNTPNAPTN